ncbi:MAG: hypothetical protein QXT43_02045 [Candidatus Micrarchaeaceae archaeon]
MAKKLLVLSDVHYPICRLRTVHEIVKHEHPDNLVMLGDNIELSRFRNHKKAYQTFYTKLNDIFPLKESIVMLGDNDYQYADDKSVAKIIEHFKPINSESNGLIIFHIGNMNFFHGNLEKSKAIEAIGYEFVKATNRISLNIAPNILAFLVRKLFGIKGQEYLFLGHLHYLSANGKNIFCGTLNREFMPFPDSLGYVTLMHDGFRVLPKSIKAVRI